jgi:amino acid transporter
MLYCTMHALGEMAVLFPVAGSFSAYSTRFLDPAWGFAMGWVSWRTCLLGTVLYVLTSIRIMPCNGLWCYPWKLLRHQLLLISGTQPESTTTRYLSQCSCSLLYLLICLELKVMEKRNSSSPSSKSLRLSVICKFKNNPIRTLKLM